MMEGFYNYVECKQNEKILVPCSLPESSVENLYVQLPIHQVTVHESTLWTSDKPV